MTPPGAGPHVDLDAPGVKVQRSRFHVRSRPVDLEAPLHVMARFVHREIPWQQTPESACRTARARWCPPGIRPPYGALALSTARGSLMHRLLLHEHAAQKHDNPPTADRPFAPRRRSCRPAASPMLVARARRKEISTSGGNVALTDDGKAVLKAPVGRRKLRIHEEHAETLGHADWGPDT